MMTSHEFEKVYHTYKDKIYSYVHTLLNFVKDDATQVTADVFLATYEYAQKHKLENIQAFLYRTAHNHAVNWIRRNNTYASCETQLEYETEGQQEDEIDKIDLSYRQKAVRTVLEGLDERARSVLYLLYFGQKSYAEIAEIMDIQFQTVGTVVKRAKQRFLDHAQAYDYAPLFST